MEVSSRASQPKDPRFSVSLSALVMGPCLENHVGEHVWTWRVGEGPPWESPPPRDRFQLPCSVHH